MLDWLRQNQTLLAALGAFSLVSIVAGALLVPVIVARMPADYFLPGRVRPDSWRGRHPVLRLLIHVGKNLLGVLLVLVGIALLVLPGQGILTILLGFSLLEFPGKKRLEIALVRRAMVLGALNWLRARSGRPPLELPPARSGGTGVRSPDGPAAPDPGGGEPP